MATYALICPVNLGANRNPGRQFIVDGIRWLIRGVDPAARFQSVDLMADDPAGWDCVAEQSDSMILCGNPRFNLDEKAVYWDLGVWDRVLAAMDAGVCLIDAWAGAAHPFPITEAAKMAASIAEIPKTRLILSYESRAHLCIARDKVAQQLLQGANTNTVLWPCSTWYSADYHAIKCAEKDRHCITLRRMPGYGWIVDRAIELQRELQRDLPTYLLAHCWEDYLWIKSRQRVHNLLCIHDPESLLRFYAHVDKLLTVRLHAAIPALALGCRVCHLSIDSRSLAMDEFDVPSVPFIELLEPSFRPRFHACPRPPQVEPILDGLKSALARIGERGKPT